LQCWLLFNKHPIALAEVWKQNYTSDQKVLIGLNFD
jgi:hypothetical protein